MIRHQLNAGSVVVITGASSGIGRATALAFARRGVALVLAGRRLEPLTEVAAECEALGASALAVQTDTADATAVQRLADRAVSAYGGRIDVWVNNAGVAAFGLFTETPMAAHEQVIRTNLIGYINGAHAALPLFLRQEAGVLINVVSMAAWAPTPMASSYSASKFGNRGFSEALRVELAGHPGIQVCDLFPAFVDTPMLAHVANYSGRKLVPVPPVITPESVARRIVRLCEHPRDGNPMGVAFPISTAFHSAFPGLFRWSVGRAVKTYLAVGPKAPPTEAALFEASPAGGPVRGGLRSPAARTLAGAVTALGAGLGMAWLLRRRRG